MAKSVVQLHLLHEYCFNFNSVLRCPDPNFLMRHRTHVIIWFGDETADVVRSATSLLAITVVTQWCSVLS